MGGFIMKKILAFLFVLTILGGSVVGNNASANFDEMPGLKAANAPIHQISHLE